MSLKEGCPQFKRGWVTKVWVQHEPLRWKQARYKGLEDFGREGCTILIEVRKHSSWKREGEHCFWTPRFDTNVFFFKSGRGMWLMQRRPSEDGSGKNSLRCCNDTNVLHIAADEECGFGLLAVQWIQLWCQLPQQVSWWEHFTWQSTHFSVPLPRAAEHMDRSLTHGL